MNSTPRPQADHADRGPLPLGPRWIAAILVLSVTIVVVTRVHSFDVLVWNVDEGVTAAMADVILDGGVPYRDGVDHRGPVTYYAYALVFALADGDGAHRMRALHAALIILVVLVVLATFAAGALAFDRRTGAVAALLVACMTTALRSHDTLAFHTEWMVLCFSLPAAICCLLALRSGSSGWLTAAGALFALAFLSKQPAGLEMVAAGAFFFLRRISPFGSGGFRRGILDAVRLGVSFAAVAGAAVSMFVLAGAWPDFRLWFWDYNTEIYVPAIPLFERIAGMLPFWKRVPGYQGALGWLVAAWVGLRLRSWWNRRDVRRVPTSVVGPDLYVALWCGAAYLGAGLSGRNFGHYYLPMLPAASLLGAHVLLYLHDEARRALRRAPSPAAGLGIVALVVLILGALSEHLPSRPETGWPPIWGMSAGESAAVAATIDRIAARTGPDDRIFVWGWMSSLYTLTDRLPGSRFLYCNFLVGMVPWTNLDDPDTRDQAVPGSWDRFHADIERLRPLYIIDTSPGDYFHYGKYSPSAVPELGRLLDRWYRREEAFRLPNGSDYLHLYRRLDRPGD